MGRNGGDAMDRSWVAKQANRTKEDATLADGSSSLTYYLLYRALSHILALVHVCSALDGDPFSISGCTPNAQDSELIKTAFTAEQKVGASDPAHHSLLQL